MKRVIIISILLCFVGCKTTKYIPVERVREVYLTDTLVKHDSIYLSHIERVRGDTILIVDTIYKWRVKEKLIETHTVDSVPQIVEVVREVRVRSGYDRFVSWFFWIVVVGGLTVLGVRLYLRFKKLGV